jgi:hypothetical protein
MVTQTALFEPFRNPATVSEIRGCVTKLFNVCADLERTAKREGTKIESEDYPMLWVLTPTLSHAQLQGWGASVKIEEDWLPGVYFSPPFWRTAIVVIHQLPVIPETLWLRMLGKGEVQKRAIEELKTLPENNSVRMRCLEFLYDLQVTLAANQRDKNKPIEADEEEAEFVMAVGSLFQQRLDAVKQEGVEEGIERGRIQGIEEGVEQGIQRGQRLILENFLRVKFGELYARMPILIESISTLSPEAFTLFLLQLSAVNNNEVSPQFLSRLFVEELLKFRWGDAAEGEDRESLIQAILALSESALAEVLVLLKSGSREEVLLRLMG